MVATCISKKGSFSYKHNSEKGEGSSLLEGGEWMLELEALNKRGAELFFKDFRKY